MKINLDVAVLGCISLCILSWIAGSLATDTPAQKFQRQIQQEQQALKEGHAVQI